MGKHTFKELLYLLRYVADQSNTLQMCDKVILENGGTLNSVSYFYQNQKMCNKTVHNSLEFVPECYKTQKMRGSQYLPSLIKFVSESLMTKKCVVKQLINALFVFYSIPDWYKTQKRAASELYLKILI